ncbi:TPA: hypothetical protein PRL28_002284 [Staphylococcus aureus]|nr:hypothetical protein [Staphylococcus aureus]
MKSVKQYKYICTFNLLISIGVVISSIIEMNISLFDYKGILLYLPFWIILFSSLIGLFFKNKLALERLSKLNIIFIYLPSYFLVWTIVRILGNSNEFNLRYEDMTSLIDFFGLVVSIIATIATLILLVSAIKYEKNKTTEDMEINRILDKENLTDDEKEEFKKVLEEH